MEINNQKVLFLDCYRAETFITILAIVLFSITDACFTLYLVSHGSHELNPVMAFFLQLGPTIFIVTKHLITSVSILGLLLIQHTYLFKNRLAGETLYSVILFIYGLTVCWEIYLISII